MAQLSGRQPRYKRILLKLSGEALMGSEEFGIDPKVLDRMALEIGQLVGIGVQVAVVIGGGNIFRGVRRWRGGHGSRHRRLHGHAGHGDELHWRCADAMDKQGLTGARDVGDWHRVRW